MAGYMKKAMSYLGMSDVVDDDDEDMQETEDATSTDFDSDSTVTPITPQTSSAAQTQDTPSTSRAAKPFPAGRINRITTIHPKTYDEAQKVGRAIRDGIPVVLNLTGVSEAVAYRIVDFSAGVVFGVRGSLERVTPRVFLLSPAQVNIKVDQSASDESEDGLF
ncbi:cell division protein SepF [Bifidobacterium sp. ESL0728]|uniref:cell division protein SepF n=1 Tax=Bifidobacterium sp. ESL0728 TaxID=2983220 RepID=UPI0023F87B97|nr:cell division protein SepF [Bifidobacterium sp. ESL0728]WEV58559.1 cell division protein SepF [Bifidobacterium sp. ESL0728]